ncbi:hypothetical protein ScPMuIL_017304 [Solemya velum]
MRKGRLPADVPSKELAITHICECDAKEEAEYVCRRCEEPACKSCAADKHRHHRTAAVGVVAGDLREEIEGLASVNRTKGDTVARKMLDVVGSRKNEETLEENMIKEIDKQINSLHKALDEVREKLVANVTEIVEVDSGVLARIEKNLQKANGNIKRLLDAADDLLKKTDDMEIVIKGYTLLDDLREAARAELPHVGDEDRGTDFKFTPGKIEPTALTSMCGKISVSKKLNSARDEGYSQTAVPVQDVNKGAAHTTKPMHVKKSLVLKNKFSMAVATLDICVTADDTVWTCGRGKIHLRGGTGKHYKSISTGSGVGLFWGITTDGIRIFVSREDGCIYTIVDKTLSRYSSSLSFTPRGLTYIPGTGELMVCGGKSGLFRVRDVGVRRVNLDLNIGSAWDCAVNDNGDICVSDDDQKKVFIFDKSYRHVATYRDTLSCTFWSRGVTSDAGGNFIVTDSGNHMIHVVSRDGVVVAEFETKKDCPEPPWSVDVSQSGKIFVMFHSFVLLIHGSKLWNLMLAQSLVLKNKFSMADATLDICVTADDTVWTCGRGKIHIRSGTGKHYKSISTGSGVGLFWGITTDGIRIFVSREDGCIYKIVDQTLSRYSSNLSFTPRGLTYIPGTGGLMVCGGKSGLFRVRDVGVQRVNLDLNIGSAWDCAVNDNGDICVSDDDQKKVFIFDKNYRHVATYRDTLSYTFWPRGVTSDAGGNFIVTDSGNHIVHIVSRDGVVVIEFETKKDCPEPPWSVDVSQSGKIFVMFHSFGGDCGDSSSESVNLFSFLSTSVNSTSVSLSDHSFGSATMAD